MGGYLRFPWLPEWTWTHTSYPHGQIWWSHISGEIQITLRIRFSPGKMGSFLRTQKPPLSKYRFKPFHWSVQGFLGQWLTTVFLYSLLLLCSFWPLEKDLSTGNSPKKSDLYKKQQFKYHGHGTKTADRNHQWIYIYIYYKLFTYIIYCKITHQNTTTQQPSCPTERRLNPVTSCDTERFARHLVILLMAEIHWNPANQLRLAVYQFIPLFIGFEHHPRWCKIFRHQQYLLRWKVFDW